MKFGNAILLIITCTIILYAIFLFVADFNLIQEKISNFKINYLPLILFLVTLSLIPIFIKWNFLLKNCEIEVPLAKSFGADCILIILSALEKNQAKEIYEASRELNLSTLIEVHDTKEAEFALTFNDSIIGINNRNLKTLEVSLNTTIDLFNVLKECKNPLVSESGIRNKSDINFILKKTGIKNFLVGESLLKSSSIKKGLKELLK